jgi:hypothetical protein
MSTDVSIRLPESRRGRRTADQQAKFDAESAAFARYLIEFQSRLDFKVGARGWAYLMENEGIITKGDLDRMEDFIGGWRKAGLLPIDFCASDEARAPENRENIDTETPKEYAEFWVKIAAESHQRYKPISFWDFQPYYIEMMVEKIDLRELFKNVCAEYHVMIWNTRGWSDINSRAESAARLKMAEEAGKQCILLYCGDLDPKGEQISDFIRINFKALETGTGWSPANLIIDRFGLNYDFIEANNLTWIDGLITSSGEDLADPEHPDHNQEYVQKYLKKYGARKVEANAMVAHHEAGRQLCREAIEKYIDPNGIKRYEKELKRRQHEVKKELPGAMKAAFDGQNGRQKGS